MMVASVKVSRKEVDAEILAGIEAHHHSSLAEWSGLMPLLLPNAAELSQEKGFHLSI